jgi:hypothetical protein
LFLFGGSLAIATNTFDITFFHILLSWFRI